MMVKLKLIKIYVVITYSKLVGVGDGGGGWIRKSHPWGSLAGTTLRLSHLGLGLGSG